MGYPILFVDQLVPTIVAQSVRGRKHAAERCLAKKPNPFPVVSSIARLEREFYLNPSAAATAAFDVAKGGERRPPCRRDIWP
jgi:hypothetical protein